MVIPGFKWFGQNRRQTHVRAKCGSGGVGFLVQDSVLDDFDVKILDDSVEGILWLSFVHKKDNFTFLSCVCYLVPANSSYNVNANDFFDNLLFQISQYQDLGAFYICGDFNARCGDMSDFIEGVDHLPERHVVDFSLNAYSDIFIDFLINVNCCIVNGRNSVSDDFTFVSTRGCSVVDYCLTPYESLLRVSNFEVIRASQLVQNANILGQVDMSYAIPDHSFLKWSFKLDCFQQPESGKRQGFERIRYKVDSIPESSMSNECIKNEIYNTIANHEYSTKGQFEIDGAYDRFCETVKQSMNKDLEKKNH